MTQFWHVAAALIALHKHRRDCTRPFGRNCLVGWSPELAARRNAAQQALMQMEAVGLVRRVTRAQGELQRRGVVLYVLTAEGLAAAKAADDARLHAIRSAAATKTNKSRPRDPHDFSARLWALLRMRKALTPIEAAETLIDAGDDVTHAARIASQYLRRWSQSHPNEIQRSAKRLGNFYRYVLLMDLGPAAPAVAAPQRAQGGARP